MAKQLPPGPGRQQQAQAKTTHGPIDRVPCPHCGKPLDFRQLNAQQLLDTGHKVSCDYCKNMMAVAGIHAVQLVVVRPDTGTSVAVAGRSAPARQATTMSPAQAQRLLRGGGRR